MDVARVRSFNRTVTQRVGALQDEYLARGRPLGASRVLWEIGEDGADVRSLRARLGLDSGYLSRLLRSLERERHEAWTKEAERLRSLGALAAGFAHQVNNPLAFVLGSLELAQQQASDLGALMLEKRRQDQAVTEIEKVPNRGHSLTIDSGWREVAERALAFVKRFVGGTTETRASDEAQ